MSPEYALRGMFSVKSDVFSFGVLLLEIVSGHKNTAFSQTGLDQDLLSYVSGSWSLICFNYFNLVQLEKINL